MALLRNMRRRLTANAVYGACRLAPATPAFAIDVTESVLVRLGPFTPVLGRLVTDNMKAAGVYDGDVARRYFENVARHLANGLRIFRGRPRVDAVRRIAARETLLDNSVDLAREIVRGGGGAILAPPHCCNYLISLARLREELPIAIYLRWSGDRRRIEMKRAWCRAAGLEVIIEPPNAANPTARAALCVDALREGRILAVTPDIAQRNTDGTPVRWLDRDVFLPAGPAALAMLAEVPLIPMFARYLGRRQTVYCEPPITVPPLSRDEGGRQEAVRRAMQSWADGFSRFIRHSPEGWFLWGDNRWTRVLRADPKYAGPRRASQPPADNAPAISLESP